MPTPRGARLGAPATAEGAGAGVGGVAAGRAMVTLTSSQFDPPLTLAARLFTVPAAVPIVSSPVPWFIVQPWGLPVIEKNSDRFGGKASAEICTVFAGPPAGDGDTVGGSARALVTPVSTTLGSPS